MRRGVTLLELTLVVLIAGLLCAIALPSIEAFTNRLAVNRAVIDLVTAHRRARITAILRSRPVDLVVSADSLVLTEPGAAVALWRAPGPSASRVLLAGPLRRLTFSPVGVTMGLSNATFRLTRGAATQAVVVSRLGRLRVVP